MVAHWLSFRRAGMKTVRFMAAGDAVSQRFGHGFRSI